MNHNPYESTVATEANSNKRPLRGWLTHVIGLTTFGAGCFSFYVLENIPMGHPAYGGPDPLRVIAVIVVLVLITLILSTIVFFRATYSRKFLQLLYSVPAIVFVANVTITIAKSVL